MYNLCYSISLFAGSKQDNIVILNIETTLLLNKNISSNEV